MTIAVYELQHSRKQTVAPRDGSSVTRSFIALRDESDTAIYTAVNAATSATYGILRKLKITLDPQGGGVWLADVEYGVDRGADVTPGDTSPSPPGGDDPLGAEVSFDTTGGTVHITQSKETVHKIKAGGGDAPDYKRAIGVSKDGVAGCDIEVGRLEFQITRNFAYVTLNYLDKLKRFTGRVNDATFLGRNAGELLFRGATGTSGSDGKVRITFKFAAGDNETFVTVSDDIELPSKGAFDHVWCAYGPSVSEGALVSRPTAAYVERVCDDADFTELGI